MVCATVAKTSVRWITASVLNEKKIMKTDPSKMNCLYKKSPSFNHVTKTNTKSLQLHGHNCTAVTYTIHSHFHSTPRHEFEFFILVIAIFSGVTSLNLRSFNPLFFLIVYYICNQQIQHRIVFFPKNIII